MTTQSWSTPVDHTSDAGFRLWGSEFASKLSACGLVQTSDTGQINWATVTRPGSLTEAGYEIWRFNDTQQGTAPIYLRIGYGTNNNSVTPRIQITVGTGSNGSGTITGTALTIARSTNFGVPVNPGVTAYQSFMCVTEGFFGFFWKVGALAAGLAEGSFVMCRSCDASGTPDALGAFIYWGSGTASAMTAYQYLRFASTAAAYTAVANVNQLPTCVPGAVSSSLAGSNLQAYLWWMAIPHVIPVFGICTVLKTEVSQGSTFAMTPVGAASRTYIGMGSAMAPEPSANTTNYATAMIWE